MMQKNYSEIVDFVLYNEETYNIYEQRLSVTKIPPPPRKTWPYFVFTRFLYLKNIEVILKISLCNQGNILESLQ